MLTIRTLHVLIRYGMFLYDMRQSTVSSEGEFLVFITVNFMELQQFILGVFLFLLSTKFLIYQVFHGINVVQSLIMLNWVLKSAHYLSIFCIISIC